MRCVTNLQPENHVILGEIPHFPRKVSTIDSANGFVSKYSVYMRIWRTAFTKTLRNPTKHIVLV
jgi:hypothetical protein